MGDDHTFCMVPRCGLRSHMNKLCRKHYLDRLNKRPVMPCVECRTELREPDPLGLCGFCRVALGMALYPSGDAA